MPVKYWLFPDGRSPVRAKLWNWSSNFVCGLAGVVCKVYLERLNSCTVYNREKMIDTFDEMRKSGRSLITYCNHDSCIDDPTTLAMMKWRQVMNGKRLRWVLVADEICFTSKPLALFFSLGKAIPTIRGEGIYQKPMDFAMEKIDQGGWVHVFPEGKINLEKTYMRFKWGIGRLLTEAKQCPIVLPYYHMGMDDALPTKTPYIPRIKKKITILVGTPIDFTEEIERLRHKMTATELRKHFTDILQEKLYALRKEAEELHQKHKES
ncbi:tafazzin-like [Saccostrea echinata]|uniref:tafazzin-like n=1 Tax=Saccostrea echinata TaxID=191078 RepID=UPI002A80A95A|nr:tafazzin-like [Saccostrea echinata]